MTIYYTGSLYQGGTKYWMSESQTEHFVTLRLLKWSPDLVNEEGVLLKTDQTIKVKKGPMMWKKGVGFFYKYEKEVKVKP